MTLFIFLWKAPKPKEKLISQHFLSWKAFLSQANRPIYFLSFSPLSGFIFSFLLNKSNFTTYRVVDDTDYGDKCPNSKLPFQPVVHISPAELRGIKSKIKLQLFCSGTEYTFGLSLLSLCLLLFGQSIHHSKALCSRKHPADGKIF